MENNGVIEQLYALRAGLSVLSQMHDDIVSLQAPKEERFQRVVDICYYPEKPYSYGKYVFNPFTVIYSDNRLAVQESMKAFFEDLRSTSRDNRSYKISYMKTGIALTRFRGINYTQLDKLSEEVDKAVKAYNKGVDLHGDAYLDSGADEIIDVLAKEAYMKWLKTEECYRHYRTVYNELKVIVDEQNSELDELMKRPFHSVRKVIKAAIAETTELRDIVQNMINNIGNLLNQLSQWEQEDRPNIALIPLKKDNAMAVFDALCVQFKPVLDVRDWKHLDLVLFYLETRRADTLKEALQQVDAEVRARRLEGTLKEAMAQIQETLAYGLASVRTAVEDCSEKLSSQLNSMSAQLASQHAETSAQLSQLTSAVTMGNALQAKANRTSEQLMNDIHYIRTTAF